MSDHHNSAFQLLVLVSPSYFCFLPKGSSFSTGTKLLCSNSARILLWGSVSSFGLKALFPAYTKQIKYSLKCHRYHKPWAENYIYQDSNCTNLRGGGAVVACSIFIVYNPKKQHTFLHTYQGWICSFPPHLALPELVAGPGVQSSNSQL